MGHSVGILLIAVAAGYWVLTLANKEKGQIKNFGQLLALLIILVSVALTACKIYYLVSCSPYGGKMFCPPSKACPFTGAKSTAPAQPQ